VPMPANLNSTEIYKKTVANDEQMGGSADNEVETKSEPEVENLNKSDKIAKMNPILLHSLKHPRFIETGSITFTSAEPKVKKAKILAKDKSGTSEHNIKHKFQFI